MTAAKDWAFLNRNFMIRNYKMQKIIPLFVLFFFFSLCVKGEEKIRIVSLSPAITEIICHLGGEKFLVGRSSSCDHPEQVKKIPVAGDFARPDLERILLLKPGYIFSNDLINPVVAKRFSSWGIHCVMKQSVTKEDYFFWVRKIGKVIQKEKEAEKEIARVRKIFSLLERKRKKINGRKKVLWVIWDAPLMAAGKKSFPHQIVEYAGGKNIAENIKSDYFKCSPEWVAKMDPQIIIFPGLSERKKGELSSRFPWNTLQAWKKDKIIFHIPQELLLRPGPRFPQGVLLLHESLYGTLSK